MPSTNDHLRAVAKSREAEYRYIKSAYLSKPVENALAALFTKEIDYHRAVDEIKRELNSRFDFTAKRCFDAIDKAYPYSTLDRNEIRDFVAEYYTILSEDDLDAIIRRCDTDEDEQISELEFKDVVQHTNIKPVATKFLGTIDRRTVLENSPRRSTLGGSPRRSTLRPTWRGFYDRYYDRSYYNRYYDGRTCTGRRSPSRSYYLEELSPLRRTTRAYSPDHRRYWDHRRGYSSYYYDPESNYRSFRHTLFDPVRSKLASARKTRSPRRSTSPKRMSETVTQETFSSSAKKVNGGSPTLRVKPGRTSQSSFNYRTQSSPKTVEKKSAFRYTLFDPSYERMTSAKRKSAAKSGYSPARQSLKTRFDVAEELHEETKTPVKEGEPSASKRSAKTSHTLHITEQDELVETLRDFIDLDKELERAKQSLALRTDFTLYDGFRVFDYDNNGYANLDDIIEAFEVFRIYPTREEARLFMTRYDTYKNNRLNYAEVCDVFMPTNESSANALRQRSAKYPNGYYRRLDEFSASTHEALTRVLKLHLEVELNAEALRQKHEESANFRYDDAFTTLNKWGDDYLTTEDFAEIFKKYGFYPTKAELDILINRFDKDRDGKVSYDEFFEEFSPHSPLKV